MKLEERIFRLEKFFKPNIEGNITLEKFEGFYEDMWMDKKFNLKFKSNRDITKIEIHYFNPSSKSGDVSLVVNNVKSKNITFITTIQERGVIKDSCTIEKDSINTLGISTTVSSKVNGDIRDLTLILEKIVFY